MEKKLTSKYCMLLENRLSEISKCNKNFRTCEYMSVSFCYLINSTINAGCFSFQLANTPFVSPFKAYLQILISHDAAAMETVGLVKTPENKGWLPSEDFRAGCSVLFIKNVDQHPKSHQHNFTHILHFFHKMLSL